MKKQLNPAIMVVAIVIVIAGAAVLLFRAATEVPPYPGQNAGKPSGEVAGGTPGSASANAPSQPVTYEQAQKMHIPGMRPGAPPPSK